MNFNYKENNGRKKLFSPNHMENMNVVPKTKIMEIITSIKVCLNSWMTINYMENGGNNTFSRNSIASIPRILIRRT